ncbi:MAG: hypothetical protein ACOX7N_05825 [Lawsonibacter sp.]
MSWKKSEENGRKDTDMAGLIKNKSALAGLANTEDARKLMAMLERQGGVQAAAKAAAVGDPSQLMAMMGQLMNSKEGAELVSRIEEQARKAGLE